VGHLNKLHEEYAAKGLVVLGVSNEDTSKVEGWVSEHGAEFPIIIEETDSANAYGAGGFPSSFIVDPDGNVAWNGHPSAITSDKVEELLTNVRLVPDLPKSLKALKAPLKKNKYAAAHGILTKTIDAGKLSEEDLKVANELRDWIDGSADSVMTSAGKKLEKRSVYGAWKAYEAVAKDFKGLPVATRAKDLAKGLLKDPNWKKEVAAGKKFAKIRKKLSGMSPKKAIGALKALTGKKYGETEAGKKAAKLSLEFEKKK